MTQINITRFFSEACPRDYSASVAEIGNNAGAYTWAAAKDDADDYGVLSTPEELQAFRGWVKGAGAWDDAEIAAWSDVELRALFIQWVSGDMRESGLDANPPDWDAYRAGAEDGLCSSNIWRDDSGAIFFSLER